MTWITPKDWADDELVTAEKLNTHLRDNLSYLYDNLPTRAWLWYLASLIAAGGANTPTTDSAQYFGYWSRQSGSANGDSFTQSFVLAPGTYTLKVLGRTASGSGKIDWTVDGQSITTGQDWYSASTVNNVIMTVTNVQITGGGRHVLCGTVNGKNASSSGYGQQLTAMWFEPSSDS